MYLCYDIKGIQRFIFSVPKLKCIVGASSLIDRFDRETAPACGGRLNAAWIFSGGGRGAFRCAASDDAEALAQELVKAAHDFGLDLRIGINDDFCQAAHHADQLHPWRPDSLDGDPCAMSGFWPVAKEKVPNVKKGVHPLIWRRVQEARQDHLGEWILNELSEREWIPERVAGLDLEFFRNAGLSAEPWHALPKRWVCAKRICGRLQNPTRAYAKRFSGDDACCGVGMRGDVRWNNAGRCMILRLRTDAPATVKNGNFGESAR